MDGILAVWKPAGWTSHDVVAKVRGITRVKRIGHAGTLDPQVTGVLPLCIGRATRVVEYLQERPKAYEAVLQLGIATDTEDMTGTPVEEVDKVSVTREEVEAALAAFIGEIDQVPPMFSALKVDGKRLYELAREGVTVERKSRKVHIYSIRLLEFVQDERRPRIRFDVECSKGTYIRTLCVDIGKRLNVPATMAELTRTMSGGLTREHCYTIEQIAALQQEGQLQSQLLPSDVALSHMAKLVTDSASAVIALQGRKLPAHRVKGLAELAPEGPARLYDEDGRFLGVFEWDQSLNLLKPVKVFN
ncbi:tRNA pseudouridine(55) synthase TruB [Paenibacillus sp. MMS18-CY102]|uniref:tRNA pseudouridine(55) synthase TruB n=1 Tax=Paenibacillus sp. MMS18-CY102 TaxID=2682849 RepID=UPI001365D37E|nr:tRNA pseudouridine(55) synthase TruB [Paenibacillus sp. MMS18-CY102]MWC26520.1 tRNA pseudouridine(55) synthase TruB [Paenibacillus sp. MMS18-CY102]